MKYRCVVIHTGDWNVEGGKEKGGKDPMIRTFYAIPEERVATAVRYEIWGTAFNESGGDFTQLRFFDADGKNIYQAECQGY